VGLFWGVEFVQNKETKMPFPKALNVARRISEMAVREPFNMTFYPGQGTVDGFEGDHIIIALAYNITRQNVDYVVETLVEVVDIVFALLEKDMEGELAFGDRMLYDDEPLNLYG
jgi:adenosylmethionine-8-amino-7-oxononanoate aminotransferase